MPFIPHPGSPPAVTPVTDITHIEGLSYSIDAGTQIYAVGIRSVLQGWQTAITNNGTVWLESGYDGMTNFIGAAQPQIWNNGLIYLHGLSTTELSYGGRHLVNTGSIFSICDGRLARVLWSDAYAFVENSGLIAAQSLGLDPDADSFEATALYIPGDAEVINHAGGRILAEAPDLAIAVFVGGADMLGKPMVTNEGLIAAHATGTEGTAIGLYVSHAGPMPATIINGGTIRAEFAIYGVSAGDLNINSGLYIENRAGGTIEGLVLLDLGKDRLVNDGAIVGDVDMGAGRDLFTGSGSVSGVVDMGFDDDRYSGSRGSDRAAGGRGDDVLRGNAGRDLLLGGFGNDSLRGDGGKDGLFGEWGDDVIYTLGGDYVEGGAGQDRVELGDYAFEGVHGEDGIDTLVFAEGIRNFSLAEMVAGGRVSGFEIVELQEQQQLALDANAIFALSGTQTLRVDASAGNTIHLGGSWTRGTDTTIDGGLYQVWSRANATVLVSEAATVAPRSIPSFGGLDAVAPGLAAPHPGAAAGLEYSPTSYYLYDFPLAVDEFTVDANEIFYSVGAPVFGTVRHLTFTNNGAIYSLDDAFPSARGLEFEYSSTLINNGLIYVEELAPEGSVYYHPSFGVMMGGDFAGVLENRGEITVYSVPGSAVAVQTVAVVRNEGTIAAISENSRAIAVNATYGVHITDGSQTFYNAGLIYAEAGGLGGQTYYLGDRFVPENYAATGVMAWGTVVNDGDIVAVLGADAEPGPATVGAYVVNFYAREGNRTGVMNNGTIEGTIAIKFAQDPSYDFDHWIINNGLLLGDVEFENGDDDYDGSAGEMRGTVYGFGGNDTLLGGKYADSFEGGEGDDTLDGGGGSDAASYARAAAGVTVDLSLTGAQATGGGGTDTLAGIENLFGSAFADTLVGNAAANLLDGGAGADRLAGGLGNDVYRVDNPGDAVAELVNQGTDTVQASVDYVLADNVENLVLVGSAAIDGSGNAAGNVLSGNSGANLLDGKGGADVLRGGGGDDVYVVDDAGDRVIERAGEGIDTVRASITTVLAVQTENLMLTGGAAIDGAGTNAANILTGNKATNELSGLGGIDRLDGLGGNDMLDGGTGNDVLLGGNGTDSLIGGAGADLLTGGGAADRFLFLSPADSRGAVRDTITDFSRAQGDKIDLSAIDAVAGGSDDGFGLAATFTGVPGQLRVQTIAVGEYRVSGDIDGDRRADFAFDVHSAVALGPVDFLL